MMHRFFKLMEVLAISEDPKEAEILLRSLARQGPEPGEYPVAT